MKANDIITERFREEAQKYATKTKKNVEKQEKSS